MIQKPVARWIAVLLASTITEAAVAQPAAEDAEKKTPSFPIAGEALVFVNKYHRTELVKDPVFIKVLVELARSKIPPEARADAFALMQERIGWLFVGTSRLFPGCGYAQTVAQTLSVYFKYQEAMPPGLPVAPLLELSKTARRTHPWRASNALLLATILDHRAARETVIEAIDAKAIDEAPVPAIDLHNLAFAAALTRNVKAVRKLMDLLPEIDSEESREDILAASSIYRDEKLQEKIEQFLRDRFPKSFDHSVTTALIVLVHVSEQDHFRDFYKSLGDLTKDREDIEKLREFWDSRFRDTLQSDDPAQSSLKIWDGFTYAMGKDGGTISYGKDFHYWISFK